MEPRQVESKPNLSSLQKRALLRALRARGDWVRAESPEEMVTLAKLYELGLVERRLWVGKAGKTPEYRPMLWLFRAMWSMKVRAQERQLFDDKAAVLFLGVEPGRLESLLRLGLLRLFVGCGLLWVVERDVNFAVEFEDLVIPCAVSGGPSEPCGSLVGLQSGLLQGVVDEAGGRFFGGQIAGRNAKSEVHGVTRASINNGQLAKKVGRMNYRHAVKIFVLLPVGLAVAAILAYEGARRELERVRETLVRAEKVYQAERDSCREAMEGCESEIDAYEEQLESGDWCPEGNFGR